MNNIDEALCTVFRDTLASIYETVVDDKESHVTFSDLAEIVKELRAENARLQVVVTAAGELIEAIRYGLSGEVTIGSMEKYERMKTGFETYTRAREALGYG